MEAPRRQRTLAWAGAAISAACLALLASRVDAAGLWQALRGASVPVLAATLVTKALAFGCLGARSRTLFGRFGRWPLGLFVRAHLLGFGGNVVLPLRVGELLRARALTVGTAQRLSTTAAVVVVERALDALWVLVLAALLPAFVALELPLPATVVASLGAVGLALALAAWLGAHPDTASALATRGARLAGARAAAFVERVSSGFAAGLGVLGSPRRLAAASAWTLAYWASSAAGLALWFVAFDLKLPWWASTVLLVFVAVGVAVPAAPGFIGTYHLAVVAGLGLFGIEPSQALAVAVVGHFLATVPPTLVAVALFYDELRRPPVGSGADAELSGPRGDAAGR